MKDKEYPQKTLGTASAELVQTLQLAGKRIFSIQDVIEVLGNTRPSTVRLLNELSKRNIITRLNAGVYLILETGQEQAQLTNWPVIANVVADTDEYYISHYAAMRLHGMTTHALTQIKITIKKRRRKKIINKIHYEFVYCKPENFWGVESHWVTKEKRVNVSDLEKTILDCLLMPEYCGGISEIATGIWLKQNEIHWEKLLDYANKLSINSVIKRLGFLLELFDIGTEIITPLQQIISNSHDYILLDPKGVLEGKYQKRWHIRINEEIAKR